MKKLFQIQYIYIIIWILYRTQDLWGEKGGAIGQILLLVYLGISLYYTVIANVQKDLPIYFKGLNLLLAMFVVYGVIELFFGTHSQMFRHVNNFEFLKTILMNLLPIYVCYVFTEKGYITEKWLRIAFIFFLVEAIGEYRIAENAYSIRLGEEALDAVTNNASYSFLALFPLLYLWKNKPTFQFLFMGYIVMMIVMALKRGAMLIAAVVLLYSIFSLLTGKSRKTKAYTWLLCVMLIVIGVYFVEDFYANSAYFQQRMLQTVAGNSSGRDRLYRKAWRTFEESNFFHLLAGHGANGTVRAMNQFAHNDWLEILVNQGVLGIFVYLFYFFLYFRSWVRMKCRDAKVVFGLSFIICFSSTLFSMSYSNLMLPTAMAIGYGLSENKKYINTCYEQN